MNAALSRHGLPWTGKDQAQALGLRAKGLTWRQIAELMGRTTQALHTHVARFADKAADAELPSKATGQQRLCLCCKKRFKSVGAHNRLCSECRRKDDGGNMWRYA